MSDAIKSAVSISALDADAMLEIFKHLSARDLARASCVNREWSAITADEGIWEHACRKIDSVAFAKNAGEQLDAIATGKIVQFPILRHMPAWELT